MSSLNFYCGKDYFPKQLPFVFVAILFCLFPLVNRAQTSSIESLSSQTFRSEIDSLQAYTPLYLHGKYIPYKVSLSNFTQVDDNTYSHTISKQYFNIQALCSVSYLPLGDTLFLYDKNSLVEFKTQSTLYQNTFLSTAATNQLRLVYKKHGSRTMQLTISELFLSIPEVESKKTEDFGDAESCQINVACEEGNEFQNQIKSTVRILVRVGNVAGWCSGTLLNTVDYSFKPYIFSAEHCGIFGNQFATASDVAGWVFYFNYQSPNCSNPASEGNLASQNLLGATVLAQSDDDGGETGSDLLLLELNTPIPESYNAYYAGWSRDGSTIPQNGFCIHHPAGDIKKISLMQGSAFNGAFGSNASYTHWLTNWRATPSGFGTTEGGSSGSALFDANGLVRGCLTGGSSSCGNTGGTDFYGKFSYSWTTNGSTPNRQLQPWLDPNGTGATLVPGAYEGDQPPIDTATFAYGPNPTGDKVFFEGLGSTEESVTYNVFSIDGMLVANETLSVLPFQDLVVSLEGLRNGIYIIKIKQGKQLYTQKVLLQNSL